MKQDAVENKAMSVMRVLETVWLTSVKVWDKSTMVSMCLIYK